MVACESDKKEESAVVQTDQAVSTLAISGSYLDEWGDEHAISTSRFDIHVDGSNQIWFCQTRYDAGSFEEALTSDAADASNPASDGCGGFPWSKLTP